MPHAPNATSLDLLFSVAQDALLLWDIRRNQARWSPAWCRITGEHSVAQTESGIEEWHDRLHPDEREKVLAALQDHLSSQTPGFESEHRLRHEDGSYRWLAVRALCSRDEAGQPLQMAASFCDITERKVLDPYTRLPNRILFLDRLERSLSRLRFGGMHAVGVLSIQLQLPASLADQLSRDEQTQLARQLGERITTELRPWDLVAQLDALEFAILLEMVPSSTDISTITDRLFKTLHQPIQIGHHGIQVSAAIGSADTTTVSGDEEHLLRAAESAARLATSLGIARHVSFDPATQEQLAHRSMLEHEIINALMDQHFEPWFQPIVQLSDGAILGFEALARWPYRDGTLLPRDFLPFLERSGLTSQLTWIILEKGLTTFSGWKKLGLIGPAARLSVNIPADQLLERQFAEQVLGLLEDMNLPPALLRLELPEKAVLRQNPKAQKALQILQEHDIEIVLDDPGTGASSLSLLQAFPQSALKIDRAFLHGLETDPVAGGMARTIIALASALNLPAIGEGVETQEQLAFLRDNGVQAAQGFLLGRPMPAREVPTWLGDSRARLMDILSPPCLDSVPCSISLG